MIVQALQKKGELQQVLAQQELQKAAMDELAKKYKEATGEVASHITEIQRQPGAGEAAGDLRQRKAAERSGDAQR